MRFTFNFLTTFTILLLALGTTSAQESLKNLFEAKQYFVLREKLADRFDDKTPEVQFFRGVAANRFNRPYDSIKDLEAYIKSGGKTYLKSAYETLADDYLRMYDYAKAADTYKEAGKKFPGPDGKIPKDYANSYGLWNALRNEKPQSVESGGETTVTGTRDKAKLLNVPVEINGEKMDFVFDTGANLSTITLSTANKLHLKLIESDVSVGSSSDIKVKSKLAVAPELKFGNMLIRNVVFLVLDDKSLFFPAANYQINGIVGFPVMEALGRITLWRDDKISLGGAPAKPGPAPTMCLEDLNMLISGELDGKPMMFTLDTGAVSTMFYPKFLTEHRPMIEKSAAIKQKQLGGAGGSKSVKAYVLPKLQLKIAGRDFQFTNAEILTEPVNEDSRNFHGNLGQDMIRQYERMTLDFLAMRVFFE